MIEPRDQSGLFDLRVIQEFDIVVHPFVEDARVAQSCGQFRAGLKFKGIADQGHDFGFMLDPSRVRRILRVRADFR